MLRTNDAGKVLIPNATVYKNQLVVQTGYGAIRTEAVVGVAYESDVDRAHELALRVLRDLDEVVDAPAPLVLVGELGASTVNLQLLLWIAPQQATVRRVQDQVLTGVKAALDAAGIEMPADIFLLQGMPSLKAALRDAAPRQRRPANSGSRRPTQRGDADQ